MPGGEVNRLVVQVEIISVDNIDNLDSVMDLTLVIRLAWRDPRLVYLNIVDDDASMGKSSKEVDTETIGLMWIPMDKIAHTNAVVGRIAEGTNGYVRVTTTNRADRPNEEYSREGGENQEQNGANLLVFI